MATLHRIAAALRLLGLAFIVIGDWNLEPSYLQAFRFLEELRADVVTGCDLEFSCASGSGRMLDFAVMSMRGLSVKIITWPVLRQTRRREVPSSFVIVILSITA